MRGGIVSDRFCHDRAHSVPSKNPCRVLPYQNGINVCAELRAKLSSSIRSDLPQGVVSCFCFMKEGLDRYSLSIYNSLDVVHTAKRIVLRLPLEFDEDLCRSGVRGALRSGVRGDLGV